MRVRPSARETTEAIVLKHGGYVPRGKADAHLTGVTVPLRTFPLRRGFCMGEENGMEQSRIALIGIIVEDMEATDRLNRVLHDYGSYIVGRMGIPYRQRGICIISVAIDAPADVISSLSGKLGMIRGISVKSLYAKVPEGRA